MDLVIAVAGPPGAGKSSLVEALAAALPDSAPIQFDHYEQMTRQPIGEVKRWMEAGADADRLPVPGLSEALQSLKSGRAVVDPLTGRRVAPAAHILFETQFGRRHAATGAHIDFLAWIDLPLDLALARKVRQFALEARSEPAGDARRFAPWLEGYMANYLDVVSALLRHQRDTVAAGADVVVDGTLEPAAQARLVIDAMRAKNA